MPRRRLRKDKRRPEADPYAVLGSWWLDLLGGFCDPADPFTKAMWERHRDDPGFDPDMYGERPWAWWTYDAPKLRDPDLGCYAQLARWGLLSDEHIGNIRKRFHESVERYRNPLCGGDLDVIELEMGEALSQLGLLTDDEHALVRAARLEDDRERAEYEKDEAERAAAWAQEKLEREQAG